MKIGTEDKKKTMIAVVLFVFAVLAVMYELWPSSSTPEPATRTTAEATAPGGKGRAAPVFSKLDPSLRLDLLKGSEDVSYSGSGRDIFHSQAAPEPDKEIEKAPDPRKQAEAAPTGPPPKPPIPLKFYGFASTNNKKQIFLAQGEDIFVAKEGDIVKGRYKVLHVNDRNVEIEDVLGNYSQQIPLTFPNT